MDDDLSFAWPTRSENWELLIPGTPVTLVKRLHDGNDVVWYPGVIVSTLADDPWVEVEAYWTAGTVVQGPITFETGDVLREFFSWQHPFNAFALYSPALELKGWYANVTYPSWVERSHSGFSLYWQDLWLDVVADGHGNAVNLDDDELEASGLALTDPGLHRSIVAARDELANRLRSGASPFVVSKFV